MSTNGKFKRASSSIFKALKRYQEVTTEMTALDKEKKELKKKLAPYIGDYEGLTFEDTPVATYKFTDPKSPKFDEDRFHEEHPELYTKYLKLPDPVRKLLVKIPMSLYVASEKQD